MGWDDIVGGILTGGLYNVGKAVVGAGEDVAAAADSAGSAVAVVGTTVQDVGERLAVLLADLDGLLTVQRLTPRPEGDLTEDEKAGLAELRQGEQYLLAQIPVTTDPALVVTLVLKLSAVRAAIRAILYHEPGVVPTALQNVQAILERFNTLEQPRVEGILDSSKDSLDELTRILVEVKKLFVVESWQSRGDGEITSVEKRKLELLGEALQLAEISRSKSETVAVQLRRRMVESQPDSFQMPVLAATPASEPTRSDRRPVDTVAAAPEAGPGDSANEIPVKERPAGGVALESALRIGSATVANQPRAIRLAAMLNQDEQSGYMTNLSRVEGQVAFQDREIGRIDSQIKSMTYGRVQQPGVIPLTLEAVRKTVQDLDASLVQLTGAVNQTLVDVDSSLVELRGALSTANRGLNDVGSFLGANGGLLKIGAGVFAGLIGLILLATLILLVKLIFVV